MGAGLSPWPLTALMDVVMMSSLSPSISVVQFFRSGAAGQLLGLPTALLRGGVQSVRLAEVAVALEAESGVEVSQEVRNADPRDVAHQSCRDVQVHEASRNARPNVPSKGATGTSKSLIVGARALGTQSKHRPMSRQGQLGRTTTASAATPCNGATIPKRCARPGVPQPRATLVPKWLEQ